MKDRQGIRRIIEKYEKNDNNPIVVKQKSPLPCKQ